MANDTRISEDQLEHDRRRFITWQEGAEFGYKAAAATALILICCGIWAWHRRGIEASDKAISLYTKLEKTLDDSAQDIRDGSAAFKRAALNIEAASADAPGIMQSVKAAADQGTRTLRASESLLDTARSDLHDNLITLNANQLKIGELIDTNKDEVGRIIGNISKGVDKLVVMIDEKDAWLKTELEGVSRIRQNVEVVSANSAAASGELNSTLHSINLLSADVQKKGNQLLFPPREKGVKGFLKRYVLAPVRTAGGIVYLYVQATQ